MDMINGRVIAGNAFGAVARIRKMEDGINAEQPSVAGSQEQIEDEYLSGLAKKLSIAAELAAQRDSRHSRNGLAELAASIIDKLGGLTYSLAKDFYDSQLPDTQDLEWLERARQANDFARGKAENPFKGFSREQLSLIVYDESGAFTVSERRAALAEKTELHNRWAQHMIEKMNVEYQQTRRNDSGLREILDFYNSLPPIEVAEYGNYEAQIMMQLSMHEVEWPEFDTSLVNMIANEWGGREKIPLEPFERMEEGAAEEGATE
ncbi:hypothetical protein [Pseudomonas sp. TE21394]